MSGDDMAFGEVPPGSVPAPQEVPEPPAPPAGAAPRSTRGAEPRGKAPFGKKWCKAHGDYEDIELFSGKDAMCKPMKQAYEGAVTQARNQKEQKFIKQLISGRPEDFQLFMARFSTEAARYGRGRLHFDIAKFRIYLTSKQGQGLKWVAKMMDQKQYFKFAQSVEGGSKTLQEAAAQWLAWSECDDQNVHKDMKNGSLRVAVHIEDLLYGYSEVETGKSVEQSKEVKQPTGDQLNEMNQQVIGGGEGLHAFGSATFQNVGGAMGRGLAQTGASFVRKDGSMGGLASCSPTKGENSFTGFLAEFGFQPEVKSKGNGRGQKRPLEEPANPHAEAAPPAAGQPAAPPTAPGPGLPPGGPGLPPGGECQAVQTPEPKKRRDNLAVYQLKISNSLNNKLQQEYNAGREIKSQGGDVQTEWEAMASAEQKKHNSCWYEIVKARIQLLSLMIDYSAKENEDNVATFWKKSSEAEKKYLGDRSACSTLYEMKLKVGEISTMDNHEAIDQVKSTVMEMVADFKEVCKDAKSALRDYRSNKNSVNKQIQKDSEKDTADAAARAAAGGRQAVARRGLGAVRAKSTPDVFLLQFPEDSRMDTYESLADFKAAVAAKKVDASTPYVVKHSSFKMSEASKTQLAVFARDFPQSLVCKGPNPLHRGQGFWKHDDTPLDDELMQFAPPGCMLKLDTSKMDPEIAKHLTKSVFFGRSPKQAYIGPDFNQMGSLRFLTDGCVKFISVDCRQLDEEVGAELSQSTEELADKLRNAKEEELQKLCESCDSFLGCIMTGGAVLYLPPGIICAERTIGGSHAYGVKKVVVAPTKNSAESYKFYSELIDKNKEEVGHPATREKMLQLLQVPDNPNPAPAPNAADPKAAHTSTEAPAAPPPAAPTPGGASAEEVPDIATEKETKDKEDEEKKENEEDE